ncbi:MAG TPA: hypothetical protein VLE02_05065 [Nitrosarchaeum sp.]|nr:hypothetical protein [Nitrosarchaeum sp.]
MQLDEKQFNLAIRSVLGPITKQIMFLLYKDNAKTYTEIEKSVVMTKSQRTSFSFYMMQLRKRKIIKNDNGYYLLTRLGLGVTKLVYDLQEICMEYDLDDCDADGRIMVMVKRN